MAEGVSAMSCRFQEKRSSGGTALLGTGVDRSQKATPAELGWQARGGEQGAAPDGYPT